MFSSQRALKIKIREHTACIQLLRARAQRGLDEPYIRTQSLQCDTIFIRTTIISLQLLLFIRMNSYVRLHVTNLSTYITSACDATHVFDSFTLYQRDRRALRSIFLPCHLPLLHSTYGTLDFLLYST